MTLTRSRILGFVVTSAVISAVCACYPNRTQTSPEFPDIPGMPTDGAAAVLFAPEIISTGDIFASTFTPDGRTVVFFHRLLRRWCETSMSSALTDYEID